jgi:hypothetical protein
VDEESVAEDPETAVDDMTDDVTAIVGGFLVGVRGFPSAEDFDLGSPEDIQEQSGPGSTTSSSGAAQDYEAEQTLEYLIGATEDEVRSRMGAPVMVAPRPPGIQWSYRRSECVLQVHFFMEIATRDFRVLSYELTGDDNDARRECASRFAGNNRQGDAVIGYSG